LVGLRRRGRKSVDDRGGGGGGGGGPVTFDNASGVPATPAPAGVVRAGDDADDRRPRRRLTDSRHP